MDGLSFGSPVPLSFRLWLNRGWIDLSQPDGVENLTPWGIELAWRAFYQDQDIPRFNSIVPTGHRRNLATLSPRPGLVAVLHPDEVPDGQRSLRWISLCQAVAGYQTLRSVDQERLLWLLHRLCFHHLIGQLESITPPIEDVDLRAKIALTTTLAKAAARAGRGADFYGNDFVTLYDEVPAGSSAAVEASYHILIHAAKHRRDLQAASRAADLHKSSIEAFEGRLPQFDRDLLWSRFYRSVAFVPMLRGDFEGMTADMDRAEAIAQSLRPGNEEERYAAAEILWPVFESRVREAQVRGQTERAERYARYLVEMTPLNPRAWLHLGETLLDLERYADALPVYQEAHRLGPPAMVLALFNQGQCHEMLDQAEPAMDCYAEALQIDPGAVTAARRLASLVHVYGGRYQAWVGSALAAFAAAPVS